MPIEAQLRPVSVAIAALGGQGGGVLAEWLVGAAELHGWIAQSTSVPGVAQRTGTTVYYVELCPKPRSGERPPVMALMPSAGDVDVVVAAELMEAGRTVVRGFVTPERTTLVASSHRVYGISEKSALGDGIADANAVLAALHSRSRRLVCFDMEALADEKRSVMSAILFGALAGSGALPFSRESYEQAIRDSRMSVTSNLAGFAAGFARALETAPVPGVLAPSSGPTTALGRSLDQRIRRDFPAHLHGLIEAGIKRLIDYQDGEYATVYLDRLAQIRDSERPTGSAYALTATIARHLALWMAYEDTIRVADLKTRRTRFERFHAEVRAEAGQIVYVTEFMHPRFEEICETLPAGLGAWLGRSVWARRATARLFRHGRHVHTARCRGFLLLHLVASLRRWRRSTLRFQVEQGRIDAWLIRVQRMSERRYDVALEIGECQRLIKGYGDTHERGLRNFEAILRVVDRELDRPDLAEVIKRLREAALADEEGTRLQAALAELSASRLPAEQRTGRAPV